MARMKVLAITYSASQRAQSEPLNGYKYLRELSRLVDIGILAHTRDRDALAQSEFAQRITYAGSERLANALRGVGCGLFGESWQRIGSIDFFDYAYFDLACLRQAKRLHEEFGFDIVHRITPTTIRWPTSIWRVGIPLVTGPHNGGLSWPAGFRHIDAREGTADRIRRAGDLLHSLAGDFDRSARIMVANEFCRAVVPQKFHAKVIQFPVNGVDKVFPQSPRAGDATRLLFVGRLVPVKCVDTIVRALARLPSRVKLTIVGDGPERGRLQALASRLGVDARIDFAGWVPQARTYEFYQKAGVFVFPSVRESGPAVVLDAMASGLPAVVAAWAGPLQFIGPDAGIALSVESPRRLADELVATIERLLGDPATGREIGRRAQERIADEFLWPSKAQRLVQIYEEVLDGGGP